MGRKLPRRFYLQDTLSVAKQLLGMHLVRVVDGQRRIGRIVETEAYQGPDDLTAHSARGRRTKRNEAMYGAGGQAYVYFIYGMFYCFNVVTRERDLPHAVLIRALDPVSKVEERTCGPGLLCRALQIDLSLNGADLKGDTIFIERPSPKVWRAPNIETSPRIGIAKAQGWEAKPWRFYDASSPHISKNPRPKAPRPSPVSSRPRSRSDR